MLRFLRYVVEIIAACVGVVIVLALVLAWRLSVHPISSDFLTPYIAGGIESILPGSAVELGSTLVSWDDAEHIVTVHAQAIRITDAQGAVIAEVPSFDARISLLGIIFGQFLPKDLFIDHPQITLEHTATGSFNFGGRAMGGGVQSDSGASGGQNSENPGVILNNLSSRLSHAVLLHKLVVSRAIFTVHDDATQKDWAISVPEISIARNNLKSLEHTRQWGALDGHLTVEVTQGDAAASVDIHYTYSPAEQRHSLSSVFNDVNPALLAGGHPESLGFGAASIVDLPLTGQFKVVFDKDFMIETAAAQIEGGAGHLAYPDFWDKPVPVKSLQASALYDRAEGKLSVSDTSVDFDGPVLTFTLDGAGHEKQADAYNAALTVDNMPMNRYDELWPKPVVPDARYWLAANLRDGMFTHAEVNLRGAIDVNDIGGMTVTDGGGKLAATNATVTYLQGMPPVENVSANAVFDLKKMNVQIMGGGIGAIRLSPFPIVITGLADPDQYIDIPLKVGGPVPDLLRLLDHPPLGYAKKLGVAPDDIAGRIDGSVHFHFPLLKTLLMQDVAINADANATGVASTKLVPGIAIDQGNLALTLDMNGFAIKGPAQLDKIPFQVTWEESFDPKPGKPVSRATVTGAIHDEQWNNFGISAFNGTKGAINVALDIVKPGKTKMALSGTVDMTPAAVQFDMLGWKKPANVPAALKFAGTTSDGKPLNVTSLSMRGQQIQANGTAVLSPDMSQILQVNLRPLILGRTNAAINLTQSFGPGGALHFDATGAALDISSQHGGRDADEKDVRPQDFHVKVDRLYMSENGEIDAAQGSATRDAQGWRALSLHGMTEGTPLSIDLTPRPDGHSDFAISSDDFGKAMKGLGLTDTISGGRLIVRGQSAPDNPRVIISHARITDFSVHKLPALALLLNATSPFGFKGILTDSADFSRFEGDFRWQGDEVVFTKAHAAGSAIGINIDGKVNTRTTEANLQGTLVPFSVVNNILNTIPLIGNILTGGQDQGVLAVAYKITGPLGAPKISVNPVSLLTPGFIRNLFFRDDAADDEE